jgi:hypothetical protein
MKLAGKDGYILSGIRNTWDTNYHLYDTDNDIEYLIDCDDMESDLMELGNIEELKELAWKTL